MLRAGWVPCVGIQPPKPALQFIEEAATVTRECEGMLSGGSNEKANGIEVVENQPAQKKNKPAMKLVMNPKGVQDHTTVESHYQQLLQQSTTTTGVAPYVPAGGVQIPASPEILKDIVNDMQSPTGKGAALFAKRKKRMDKFIVDESNVQKTSAYSQEQQSCNVVQQTTFNQFNSTTKNTVPQHFNAPPPVQGNKKKSIKERDNEQKEIMENFLKNRESEYKLVKSPWESVLETGSASSAFKKNQQPSSLLNLGGTASPSFPSWMDMPQPVPVTAPLPKVGPSAPLPTPPSLFGTKPQEPALNAAASPFMAPPASAAAQPKPSPVVAAPKPAPAAAFTPRAATTTNLTRAELDERRKSANFNLAANGWGKFNSYYKPVSFAS